MNNDIVSIKKNDPNYAEVLKTIQESPVKREHGNIPTIAHEADSFWDIFAEQ
ncbi:MAG: hypothetical protein MR375_03370 [Veillonellaceae bacterium]|nr:hypothetical protein [Veillonellaceae bacterium]